MVNVAERPNTLDDTIQEINPVLCPNMYTAVVILLVMSVSPATHLLPCDATVTTERLSRLALIHVHKNKTLDAECIIHQFSCIALTVHPNEGDGSY